MESTEPTTRRAERIHPAVYKIMLGLIVWMILAAWWGFFSDAGYTGLLLTMVTGFAIMAVVVPYKLWRLRAENRELLRGEERDIGSMSGARVSFRDWSHREVGVWQSRLRGSDAAIAALVPLAAGAVGMTAFAIVVHIARAAA